MRPEIGPVEDEFIRVLFAQDELGAVVRAHIMIEAQVNKLIEGLVFDPRNLPNLRFEQRARLMVALGASEDLLEPLAELGRIRNAFGHRLDTKITEAMVDKWFKLFSESDRAMMERANEKTRTDLGQPPAKLAEHDPKSKFILIAVGLRQILRQMQADLHARKTAT
jgi:hypothetical protein